MVRVYDHPDDDAWIGEERRAIGDRIKAERMHRNLTQDQVWQAAGISRYTLQRTEAGEEVTLATLLRVLKVLGLTVGLVERTSE